MELAIRTVSHLWILRQVFPRASSVAGLPPEWPEILKTEAATDFALSRRIEDLASNPFAGGAAPTSSGETVLAVTRTPPTGPAVAIFADHLHGIVQTGSEEPNRLPGSALAFRKYDSADNDVLTRDEITESLANLMLANGDLMRTFASALHFEPQMLTEIKRRSIPESELGDWPNPKSLRELADRAGVPIPFSLAQREELAEIEKSRRQRLDLDPIVDLPNRHLARQQAFDRSLFGLAISGGGIRSATFALGILQSMADSRLLGFLDYLSTVSGGGYIGSWLLAWIKRRGSIQSVQARRKIERIPSQHDRAQPTIPPPPPHRY